MTKTNLYYLFSPSRKREVEIQVVLMVSEWEFFVLSEWGISISSKPLRIPDARFLEVPETRPLYSALNQAVRPPPTGAGPEVLTAGRLGDVSIPFENFKPWHEQRWAVVYMANDYETVVSPWLNR